MTQSPIQRRLVRLAGSINQKARRLGDPERIRAEDLGRKLADTPQCVYCGIDLDSLSASFDHQIPFDRGGTNSPSNLVACCLSCQRHKFTKLPGEFAAYQNLRVNCLVCGRDFKPRWADYRRGYGRTCSRACAGTRGGER